MKIGDYVKINPNLKEDEFTHGLAGIKKDDIGKIIDISAEEIEVEWLTNDYGKGWNGLENELILLDDTPFNIIYQNKDIIIIKKGFNKYE